MLTQCTNDMAIIVSHIDPPYTLAEVADARFVANKLITDLDKQYGNERMRVLISSLMMQGSLIQFGRGVDDYAKRKKADNDPVG